MIETCLRGSLEDAPLHRTRYGRSAKVIALVGHQTQAASDLITIHLGQAPISSSTTSGLNSWRSARQLARHEPSARRVRRSATGRPAFQSIGRYRHDTEFAWRRTATRLGVADGYRIFEYVPRGMAGRRTTNLLPRLKPFAVRPYAAPVQFDTAMHQRQAKTEARRPCGRASARPAQRYRRSSG